MSLENSLKESLRQEPWGKLLVRYGFEPYNTESSARRVAEKAAAEIAELQGALDAILAVPEIRKAAANWAPDELLRARFAIRRDA